MIRNHDGELWTAPVWADFMARDERWRVPLDFPGTAEDLARNRIDLREGLKILLYTDDATDKADPDDLVTVGTVEYDQDAHRWFALIDPQGLLHVSELDDLDRSLYSARSRRTL
jgi:hypothetical protein